MIKNTFYIKINVRVQCHWTHIHVTYISFYESYHQQLRQSHRKSSGQKNYFVMTRLPLIVYEYTNQKGAGKFGSHNAVRLSTGNILKLIKPLSACDWSYAYWWTHPRSTYNP